MSFFHKSGIVNVKMVITEEKILSNIDKVQKLINPNSKKQIVQLEEDSYFKDLVESIKTYLLEYPRKKNFPANVYKSAYDLVEYATNQFEENTKKIEELIRKRERNIKLASVLREVTVAVKGRAKNWKDIVKKLQNKYPADVVESLTIIGNTKDKENEEYKNASKLLDTKVNNLESNLHIEIDMERIEDRSKALSYIGIEIAEALKYIPAPVQEFVETQEITSQLIEVEPKVEDYENKKSIIVPDPIAKINKASKSSSIDSEIASINNEIQTDIAVDAETSEYFAETRFEVKPSLWQRIKNSKLVRTISYIMKIRVVLDYPALPEGRENY